MSKTLCILGRQPSLSVAELESVFNAELIQLVGKNAVLVNLDPEKIDLAVLGGTMKVCEIITQIPYHQWPDASSWILNSLPEHLKKLPEGKIKLGISAFDISTSSKAINATALELKKRMKNHGRSLRAVPNQGLSLNSAQVLRNKLTSELGIELVLYRNGREVIIARTTAEQDIDAYAARDQRRPKRDARVGMLPPKLAQIIINLGSANSGQSQMILDPFCGTGVVLQEALLMGKSVYGTDIEPRMIQYSEQNLEWLADTHGTSRDFKLGQGDATSYQWKQAFDAIACETYLGRPFSSEPQADKLNEVIRDVDTIHRKFLQNVRSQTQPGFKMCIAVPSWFIRNRAKHLPILDHLTDMGYTRMSFVHADDSELIYRREDQIVGRELVVLTRK